jgi:rhodanese-related sulfurtransferase
MKTIIYVFWVILLLIASGCGQGYSEGGFFPSVKEMVWEAKADIEEISPEELRVRLEKEELRVLIDVRENSEFEEGYINQPDEEYEYPYPETFTVNIPRGVLEFKISSQDHWDDELWIEMPDKEEAIVLYCKTGERSALAAHALMQLGYRNVKSLKGGYRKWLDPNAPEEEAVKSSGGCG